MLFLRTKPLNSYRYSGYTYFVVAITVYPLRYLSRKTGAGLMRPRHLMKASNMASNVFISYDLYQPKENYEQVRASIESMGSWTRIHLSLWFVKTDLSAEAVAAKIWEAMESNDKLIVVDATNNAAYWYGLIEEVSDVLAKKWGE